MRRPGLPFDVRGPSHYGDVVGLPFRMPEPLVEELAGANGPPDVVYIVSIVVAQKLRTDWRAACAGPQPEQGDGWYGAMLRRFPRDDVFSPGELVRDGDGQIIGCRNLVAAIPLTTEELAAEDVTDILASAHRQGREQAAMDLIEYAFKLRTLKADGLAGLSGNQAAAALLGGSAYLNGHPTDPTSPTWWRVVEFAWAMELMLSRNRHKGSRGNWMRSEPEALWQAAARNLSELEERLHALGNVGTCDSNTSHPVLRDILRRAANVANYALMVADRSGALELLETMTGTEETWRSEERMHKDLSVGKLLTHWPDAPAVLADGPKQRERQPTPPPDVPPMAMAEKGAAISATRAVGWGERLDRLIEDAESEKASVVDVPAAGPGDFCGDCGEHVDDHRDGRRGQDCPARGELADRKDPDDPSRAE